MTVKIDEQMLIDLIKDYFQDNDMPPVELEEGDKFEFKFTINCIEGVLFVVTGT